MKTSPTRLPWIAVALATGAAGSVLGAWLSRPAATPAAPADRAEYEVLRREVGSLRREVALARARPVLAGLITPEPAPEAAHAAPEEPIDPPEVDRPAVFFQRYFRELDDARARAPSDPDFGARLQAELATGDPRAPGPRLDAVACGRELCRLSFATDAGGPAAVAAVRQALDRTGGDLPEVSIYADGAAIVAYAARAGFSLPVPNAD